MRNKGPMLFWTDMVNVILFAALMATGSILRWVLPPGSGGGQHDSGRGFRGGRGPAPTLLDWTRHEWGDVHFWIAVALVAGIAIHLLLHWGWLKASTFRYLNPRRLWRRRIALDVPVEWVG